jgi:prepilin-type N-terminal cleavage/methylation domain-containing protein
MKKSQCGRGPGGFTLIEMLVVLCIVIILMLFAVPALQTYVRQGKLRGIASETAILMRLARLEAIKRSCQSVVRIVEGDSARVEGFPDCDGDCVLDADKPSLGRLPLPYGVHFLAPPNRTGKDSIGDLTSVAACGAAKVAVFQPDGSIETPGGFRFGDDLGNFLEVWVAPKATARIEVHKCRLCTNADLREDWYAVGDGGEAWTWK